MRRNASRRDRKPAGAYETGYGKPPRSGQFKPGQSGNPSGRKKGAKNLVTIFDKMLNDKITIREGERVRTVSAIEALILSIRKKAMEGNTRAIALFLQLAEDAGRLTAKESEFKGGVFAVPARALHDATFEEDVERANREGRARYAAMEATNKK